MRTARSEATILYAADGTEIRTDEGPRLCDWAVAVTFLLGLVLVGFIAGWTARDSREPRVEWKSNSYEIGEPVTPPTYFPPGGHRPIVYQRRSPVMEVKAC